MSSPRDEEYSRITDPSRYRGVHVRARLWASVLEEVPRRPFERLEPVAGDAFGRRWFRSRGMPAPAQPDAVRCCSCSVRCLSSRGRGISRSWTSPSRPDVVVASQPDCGCDACDSGSDDLLRAIDEAITPIIGGPYVVLRGKDWHAEWHPGGGSAGSQGSLTYDFDTQMDACQQLAAGQAVRLPDDTEVFVGQSWVDETATAGPGGEPGSGD